MLPSLGLHIRLPMAHEHIDFSRCYMASSIMHSFPPTVLYTVHHKAEIHSRGRTHVVAVDDQEMTTDARLQGESVPVPPTLLLSPSPSFSWEASPLLTHARGWRGQTRHRLPSLPGTQTHADIRTHTHTHTSIEKVGRRAAKKERRRGRSVRVHVRGWAFSWQASCSRLQHELQSVLFLRLRLALQLRMTPKPITAEETCDKQWQEKVHTV